MSVYYEPFSPEIRANPYPVYARLRAEAPVYWAKEAKGWVLSRYEDVHYVLTEPELFSSEAMGAALSGRPPETTAASETPRIVIQLDPPDHAPMRGLLNRGFTPRRISQIEIRLREIVAEAMRGLCDRPSIDVVSELAVPVPTIVIAELLGIGKDRLGDFRRWSKNIIAGVVGSKRPSSPDAAPDASFLQSVEEMRVYLGGLAEARRKDPRDDLLSQLVAAEAGAAALNPEEVLLFAFVLLIAGNETTTNLIGSLVRALLEHPDQLAKVLADRSLIPNAIEETLRCEAPIQFFYRRARKDVERHGTLIRKGDIVIGLTGSANRDERRYANPDRFDITRDASGHLTFGFGIHYCLGASLARLEAQLVLEALLDELPKRRLDASAVDNVDSFLFRGPRALVLERVA